jgi:putative membrane-bound dehydrogenase-like protein
MIHRVVTHFAAACGLALASATTISSAADAVAEPSPVASPVSPQESLEHLVVDPGLRVELVASEPQIVDPVAMRFDEDGRLWVVQMNDYPTGDAAGKGGQSRISILEDRDGDGFFETANEFADGLNFATGVQPWQGGAFVTMAGTLEYLKDGDGDGRADEVTPIYSGFALDNTQLRANDPTLALDGGIYVANGLRGGTIVDVRDAKAKPLSISGMDFRFDPRTYEYEATAGSCQFGMSFDDFGNRFICSNRNPAMHVVMSNRDMAKNPLAAIPRVVHDVAAAGADSHLFPITTAWTTSNLHAGQFTAACGVEIYRGDALPADYYGNVLTCDPTNHLVHREVVAADGATFTSQPATPGKAFFASRDPWSSPVNLELGPDGALYVVDMYRAVIEHPEWMPEELRNRPDMGLGLDRGRIYRIVAEDAKLDRSPPKLGSKPSSELVAGLSDANAWRRETCARLLLERDDASVAPQLRELVVGEGPTPARIHALWLLHNLDEELADVLPPLLADADPRIVEQAIIVAARRGAVDEALQAPIESLLAAADARVRFQATLALAPHAIGLPQPADAWQEYALLIAAGERGGTALADILRDPAALAKNVEKPKQFIAELAKIAVASDDPAERSTALEALLASPEYGRVGLAAFLAQAGAKKLSVESLRRELNAESQSALDGVFAEARDAAADAEQTEDARLEAIELAALLPGADALLVPIALDEDAADPVRLRAIRGLIKSGKLAAWQELVAEFAGQPPAWQGAVLDGLLASGNRTTLLLDELAAGRITSAELGAQRLPKLLNHADAALKARAEKVLSDAAPADRKQVLEDYQIVLDMKGDPAAGRAVFQKHCAACHRIGDVGYTFAPDISDSREKTPTQILTDILQPNRAVDANFFNYAALTYDGLTHDGILTAETPTSITLKQGEGKEVTLLREDVDQFASTGRSLMPEGLEKEISHQQMADLIAFIKNWRYLDGSVPLGTK